MKAKTLIDDPASCGCAETLLYNEKEDVHYRVPKPKWHSCDYIRIVNSKIAENAVIADKLVAEMPDGTAHQRERRKGMWVSCFSRHMDHDRLEVMRRLEEEERLMRIALAPKEKDDTAATPS